MTQRNRTDEFWVFDYGSLSYEKLTSIVGDVEVVCGAILPRSRIVFAGSSKMFGGSTVATVVLQDGYEVMGVVYKIKEMQLELLDLFMGSSLGLTKRVKSVVHDGRANHGVYMYVLHAHAMSPKGRPSPAYAELHMKLVREGYELYRKQVAPAAVS